jgi:hypothetical protein
MVFISSGETSRPPKPIINPEAFTSILAFISLYRTPPIPNDMFLSKTAILSAFLIDF